MSAVFSQTSIFHSPGAFGGLAV